MPYKSEAQRRYFNSSAGKKKIGEEEVEHWNEVSKGKKLPEKALDKAIRICDDEYYGGYLIKPLKSPKGTNMHGAVGAYKNSSSKPDITGDNVKELKKEIDELNKVKNWEVTFYYLDEHDDWRLKKMTGPAKNKQEAIKLATKGYDITRNEQAKEV